jgi:aspartyl-tRNA(Asn)/glutamyl-tRNA(Gln) amidotransferase subunit A
MTPDSLCSLTLAEASAAVRDRKISPVELTCACLARIERLDPEFNSFISVYSDQALSEAERFAAELQERTGWRGPLHGIPIAIKDLIDVAGEITTAASALFLKKRATHDAEVVRQLKRAGAIILGKTNLHEFAYGGSGMISHFGPVRNPINPDYITGGSSSGSAAAVAAKFCFGAIGTDTSGSIRLPAACCGVVGLKPTFGTVSTNGIVPLSWSYDHVGPITRSVADAEILFEAITDRSVSPSPSSRLRVAVARNFFFEQVDPEIATTVAATLQKLSHAIVLADPIEIPVNEDRTVSNAEAYAYHKQFVAATPELYQKETLRRIRSGEHVTASEYTRKRHELEELRYRASAIFERVDVLITPTVPTAAPRIDDLQTNPDQLRPCELLMLRNTRPFNVLGWPAISIPCGATRAGLPIGIQLAAAPGREDHLFAVGKLIEAQR